LHLHALHFGPCDLAQLAVVKLGGLPGEVMRGDASLLAAVFLRARATLAAGGVEVAHAYLHDGADAHESEQHHITAISARSRKLTARTYYPTPATPLRSESEEAQKGWVWGPGAKLVQPSLALTPAGSAPRPLPALASA
jgi:hypothetical protein